MTTSRDSAESGSARQSRRHVEDVPSQHRAAGEGAEARLPSHEVQEFRVDLERIRFSPYFTRLASVTQVVPQSGVGPVMHNRLTHSLKVSSVARVIAANLAARQAHHRAFLRGELPDDDPVGAVVERLGGCDTIVAQAAAHAHDMGHPPFGHLGERALDRIARERLGLDEGFEGNAQTLRILTRLDSLGREFPGLNLTAAVRASVLKYPWTHAGWREGLDADDLAVGLPRGVGDDAEHGAAKFSSYVLEAEEMESLRAVFPQIGPGRQTLECAVMDVADDIAYAIHDLDEFTRAGVLQHAAVVGELDGWLRSFGALSKRPIEELEASWRDMASRWSCCGGGCSARIPGSPTARCSSMSWPTSAATLVTSCSPGPTTAGSTASGRCRSSPGTGSSGCAPRSSSTRRPTFAAATCGSSSVHGMRLRC